jgi:hypothetical protein
MVLQVKTLVVLQVLQVNTLVVLQVLQAKNPVVLQARGCGALLQEEMSPYQRHTAILFPDH